MQFRGGLLWGSLWEEVDFWGKLGGYFWEQLNGSAEFLAYCYQIRQYFYSIAVNLSIWQYKAITYVAI